jgi:hypothetical protein
MHTNKYNCGQKIYHTGDIANMDGWFWISHVSEKQGIVKYELTEIDGEGRVLKDIPESSLESQYFLTEYEYRKKLSKARRREIV